MANGQRTLTSQKLKTPRAAALAGILFAVLVGTDTIGPFQKIGDMVPWFHPDGTVAQVASALLFFALALVTARAARRKIA